ncbi:phytoene/squalene synthase family protein [Pararhizobium haloflavum]|uniref:phytoene/squalene synthase family protein n=1 Tax=Pararhizobium haloflavum TaxID=2037914 RepID=UPI000C17C9C0|nr:phytoene/squalene synthase family protein [Pararhizobium haloflavum]
MSDAGNVAPERIAECFAYCLTQLRDLDRDRYLACLLAPEAARGPLATLYLFNAEIARLRELVTEPIAGEMRIQWWRDVVTAHSEDGPAGNPLAEALTHVIAAHKLPVSTFAAYLDARTFDLYDDPMPDRQTFEGYAGETASALIQLSFLILAPETASRSAHAAGHAGVAQAVAGTLQMMPIHSARGQVYVPGDLLAACGLDRDLLFGDPPQEGLQRLVAALVAYGREHLDEVRNASVRPTGDAFAALLPVALAEPIFRQAERRRGIDPRHEAPSIAQWKRQLILLKARVTGRI